MEYIRRRAILKKIADIELIPSEKNKRNIMQPLKIRMWRASILDEVPEIFYVSMTPLVYKVPFR